MYQVAYSVAAITALVTSAFQTAWSPFAYSIYKVPNAREVYAKTLLAYVWVASLVAAGTAMLAPEVLPLVFPLHPRGRKLFRSAGLTEVPNVHVVEPLGYIQFLSLVSGAALVLTDSGGLQTETAVLGVPCVTVRPNTEWRVTIEYGTNRLCSPRPEDIAEVAHDALGAESHNVQIPLWDGKAGERIAAVLSGWSP